MKTSADRLFEPTKLVAMSLDKIFSHEMTIYLNMLITLKILNEAICKADWLSQMSVIIVTSPNLSSEVTI